MPCSGFPETSGAGIEPGGGAEDLIELMGPELAREALADFDATARVREMAGPVPEDSKLALSQLESMTYLRNQLLRDSDWASMDHSVELRTPLVDAYLLGQMRGLLPQFAKFPNTPYWPMVR